MSVNLTLNFIRDNWCSATANMERRDFCLSVLPDCYDPALCREQGSDFFTEGRPRALAPATLNSLMRGNRKSSTNPACASVSFTKDFLGKLHSNDPIRYRDPERPDIPCVSHMVEKIRHQVRSFAAPRSRNHPLFTHADLAPLGECDETLCMAYNKVQCALGLLLERETEYSLSYAIFLLVITSILQDRIQAVSHLYSMQAIEQVLESDHDAPLLEIDSRMHVPFTDPNYMNSYHVYLYRETSTIRLVRGVLTMSLDERRQPRAVLRMDTDMESPFSGLTHVQRVYSGKPMLNKTNQVVYLPMTNAEGAMLYLTFPYTVFKYAPMYFRSATVVYTDAETGYPVVKRMVLTGRDMTEEEIPYVEGLLRTGGKRILMTPKQLEIFREEFRDYPWMADFLKNYLPMFESHQLSFYCFNEDELLACSASELPYADRLRLMLALKSVSPPNDPALEKFLKTVPPSKTYSIMK